MGIWTVSGVRDHPPETVRLGRSRDSDAFGKPRHQGDKGIYGRIGHRPAAGDREGIQRQAL